MLDLKTETYPGTDQRTAVKTTANGHLEITGPKLPPEPPTKSLAQAELIQDSAYCPYCGHKRGTMHPVIEKPLCIHQVLAGEVIAKNRRYLAALKESDAKNLFLAQTGEQP
jgi:hypothetical protein